MVVTDNAVERLPREKFEACVLKLSPGAELVMDSVRRSASNGKMVIYGLGGSAQEAMQYSKYGINAVFHEPVQRPAVLKVVRATQMLVAHEFRRYLRIPVITEISVVTADNRRFTAISQEVSSGGMSIKSDEEMPLDQALEISFALLTLPRIWVRGTVCWAKPASKTFGIRDGIAMVWAQRAGLRVGFLSARTSASTAQRAAQILARWLRASHALIGS